MDYELRAVIRTDDLEVFEEGDEVPGLADVEDGLRAALDWWKDMYGDVNFEIVSASASEGRPLIRIVFTEDDVRSIIDDADPGYGPVPTPEKAMERAHEWSRHIEGTALNLISEQLESVVLVGQP